GMIGAEAGMDAERLAHRVDDLLLDRCVLCAGGWSAGHSEDEGSSKRGRQTATHGWLRAEETWLSVAYQSAQQRPRPKFPRLRRLPRQRALGTEVVAQLQEQLNRTSLPRARQCGRWRQNASCTISRRSLRSSPSGAGGSDARRPRWRRQVPRRSAHTRVPSRASAGRPRQGPALERHPYAAETADR